MELKLTVIITSLLFLSVLRLGNLGPADQFQFPIEKSGVCLDDKETNMQEDEFSTSESFNKKIFFPPQATLCTSNKVRTSILNFEIWKPPKN